MKAATDRHGERWQGKKERVKQKMEEKVEGKTLGEESAEVQSPTREVIRVESDETQDYVRESLNLSLEEAEEMSVVPRAVSIPPGPMFGLEKPKKN